jgi:hypothetical protein
MDGMKWKLVRLETYLVLGIRDDEVKMDTEKVPEKIRRYFFEPGMDYEDLKGKCEENGFTFTEIASI